jgi:hypothetical protein
LRQEFLVRTSGLGVSEDQHYVYPGVRGPLLLPLDYIRKYLFLFLECLVCFLFGAPGNISDFDFCSSCDASFV